MSNGEWYQKAWRVVSEGMESGITSTEEEETPTVNVVVAEFPFNCLSMDVIAWLQGFSASSTGDGAVTPIHPLELHRVQNEIVRLACGSAHVSKYRLVNAKEVYSDSNGHGANDYGDRCG